MVDKAWTKLLGKWVRVDERLPGTVEFLPSYTYIRESGPPDEHRHVNPVTKIRDDSRTTRAKSDECYTLFYQEGDKHRGRMGGEILNFMPDGTIDMNKVRFRRQK